MYVVYEYVFSQGWHSDTSIREVVFVTESSEIAESYCKAMNELKGKSYYSYGGVPVEDEIFVITRERDNAVVAVCTSEEETDSVLRKKKISHIVRRVF